LIGLGLGACALVMVTCTACASASGDGGGSTSTTSTTSTTTASPATTAPVVNTYVTLNGKRFEVPTERPGHPISPIKDVGQQIVVMRGGLFPKTLYAFRNKPIVWTNLTDRPIRVAFSHFPLSKGSGEIAPGGTFSYTVHNDTVIAYATTSGLSGILAVSILPTTNP
jgi:hypothetical protein